ncbi:ABC transporter permease [Niabella drilacis]|uniref:Putative ABC transport system permease protein n=1 Tax=Niabella drilacis (strain DSM 25811 / CCM 8410 / CCUG 62505 / LMG 26954 / E90) TaxID=1285928 RepID=A0A1G7AI52_NIADE|nr:ABC transporter permease [Niabella drilacis]SDE14479.1 putative ABC transport system permease protein [Niabella drilacis]
MLRNDFKIAWRQLKKQKLYAVIKIGGFALSIAACLLIALFIRDELSYDRSYPDADRIYRLIAAFDNRGKREKGWSFPAPVAQVIRQDFPEVEQTGRLMPSALFDGAGSNQVRSTDMLQNTYEDKFAYADQSLLDILKLPMVYGNRATALAEPNTMVLTKAMADKYFPDQDPVGKTMILNENKERIYKIGGVIQDFPATSHFPFRFLLTLTDHELWPGEQSRWNASNYSVYMVLKKGKDPAVLQNKFKEMLTRYYLPVLKSSGAKDPESVIKNTRLMLQPLTDIHLRSADINDWQSKGDIRFVWLFGAVACFILIIACINFINLSTARSASRAKEVGLRKVVGSHRSGLVRQFLMESVGYSLASFVLGLVLAILLLPYFNQMAARSLTIPWSAWWLLPLLLLGAVGVGLVAGLYPAFYLSAFKPAQVLKGTGAPLSKRSFLRNGLVVFQFATSVVLIVGTVVVYRQTHYLLNRNAGFDKDQVMLLQGTGTLDPVTVLPSLKNELLKIAQVKQVSVSDYLPVVDTKRDGNPFYREGRTKEDAAVGGQKWYVDADYIKTMGMQIASGRDFSKELASDTAAVVINEAMVKALGLKDPVGQRITNGWQTFTVIGIIKDFNFETMRREVAPLCLTMSRFSASSMIAVKIDPAGVEHTIASITAAWKSFAPHQPVRFTFLDERFAGMYADVQRMGMVFSSFAMLSIFIACLGLFALSAFTAEQRIKEIGVRKVLGAGVGNLAVLLSKDFIKLVLIALAVAMPFTWWVMERWLQDFAYRIKVTWWMFLVAGSLVIMVALVTVSFQAIRAAIANPVKALRSE